MSTDYALPWVCALCHPAVPSSMQRRVGVGSPPHPCDPAGPRLVTGRPIHNAGLHTPAQPRTAPRCRAHPHPHPHAPATRRGILTTPKTSTSAEDNHISAVLPCQAHEVLGQDWVARRTSFPRGPRQPRGESVVLPARGNHPRDKRRGATDDHDPDCL